MKNISLVERAINLWCEITGMPLVSKKYTFSLGDKFDIFGVNRDLKSSLDLDETGITSLLMLDYFVKEYFKTCSYTVEDLLNNPNGVQSFLDKCKELKQILVTKEIESYFIQHNTLMKNLFNKIGIQRDFEKDFEDKGLIGYLRRDALRSLKTLSVYQFSQGERTAKENEFKFSSNIYIFKNIASIVKIGLNMEDGVFLALVRDTSDIRAYFVIVVKNGGNLTILTDHTEDVHPLSQSFARSKPQREFIQRVEKHHFPYDLLDCDMGFCKSEVNSTSLVTLQKNPIILGNIKDLKFDEIYWLVLVFSGIQEKLFKGDLKVDELSYCSIAMRKDSELAIEMSKLPAVFSDVELEMAKNTVDNLDNDNQYKSDYDEPKVNQWILEKYRDEVPEDILNDLTSFDTTRMLKKGDSNIVSVSNEALRKQTFFETQERERNFVEFKGLTGLEFGSKEKLEKDYRFLARYNEASYIQMLNEKDYQENREKVFDWLRKRVEEQKFEILKKLVASFKEERKGSCWSYYTLREYNNGDFIYYYNGIMKFRTDDEKCYWSAKMASYVISYNPSSIEDLLYILGLNNIEELPSWLQHWHLNPGVKSNFILQRVDPVEWVIKDLWNDLRLRFMFFISKSMLNKICKKEGVQNILKKKVEKDDKDEVLEIDIDL